jgi:2-phosphosulfolactate phosphatase
MTEVRILQLEEGARQARGLTVIIDVFRAFSLECVLFGRGAERIICSASEERTRRMHAAHPETLLIGERGGRILPGFDYGNSPAAVAHLDFHGRTILHTTTNGTRGLAAARGAEELLAGSLLNARATAAYILRKHPAVVSLVCMGWQTRETEEDTLCAAYLKSLILQKPFPDLKKKCLDLQNTEGKKFFCPDTQDVFPQDDFWICIQPDQYDFVITCQRQEGFFINTPVRSSYA